MDCAVFLSHILLSALVAEECYQDLSAYIEITNIMPNYFWYVSSQAVGLDISGNRIGGILPLFLEFIPAEEMDFSSKKPATACPEKTLN